MFLVHFRRDSPRNVLLVTQSCTTLPHMWAEDPAFVWSGCWSRPTFNARAAGEHDLMCACDRLWKETQWSVLRVLTGQDEKENCNSFTLGRSTRGWAVYFLMIRFIVCGALPLYPLKISLSPTWKTESCPLSQGQYDKQLCFCSPELDKQRRKRKNSRLYSQTQGTHSQTFLPHLCGFSERKKKKKSK